MDRVKRIWYLSPMRAAKVQASLRIRAVSPEPPLLALTSGESRGTFRQKGRSLASLNGWACAVKTCHHGMLEDTNSLDGAHIYYVFHYLTVCQLVFNFESIAWHVSFSCILSTIFSKHDMPFAEVCPAFELSAGNFSRTCLLKVLCCGILNTISVHNFNDLRQSVLRAYFFRHLLDIMLAIEMSFNGNWNAIH